MRGIKSAILYLFIGVTLTIIIQYSSKSILNTSLDLKSFSLILIFAATLCLSFILIYSVIKSPKDKTSPLGLPSGSIRGIIALLILLFFVLLSIFFYANGVVEKDLVADILKTLGTLVIAVSAFYFGSKATEQGSKIAAETFSNAAKTLNEPNKDTDVPIEIIEEALSTDNNRETWKKQYNCIDVLSGKKQTQNTTQNLNCLIFIVESKDNLQSSPPIPPNIPFISKGKTYNIPTDVQLSASSNNGLNNLPTANEDIITEAVKENGEKWVDSFPNVTGLSVRNKITKESETKFPALIFKVTTKEKTLDFGKIPVYLPYTFKEIKYKILTDVVQEDIPIGHLKEADLDPTPIIIDNPPFPIGNSVSREGEQKNTGSIGLVVRKDGTRDDFIISCYHVFCAPEFRNNGTKSSVFDSDDAKLISPSIEDNGTTVIGHVVEGDLDNESDFAIGKLQNTLQIDDGRKLSIKVPLTSFGSVFLENKNDLVFICGRSSGIRKSFIKSHIAPQTVFYYNEKRKNFFKALIEIQKVSKGGDSGGVVLNTNDEIIGLIVAGNSNSSYVLPVEDYLSKKGYSLKPKI